jgi:hypothetical protein
MASLKTALGNVETQTWVIAVVLLVLLYLIVKKM